MVNLCSPCYCMGGEYTTSVLSHLRDWLKKTGKGQWRAVGKAQAGREGGQTQHAISLCL